MSRSLARRTEADQHKMAGARLENRFRPLRRLHIQYRHEMLVIHQVDDDIARHSDATPDGSISNPQSPPGPQQL